MAVVRRKTDIIKLIRFITKWSGVHLAPLNDPRDICDIFSSLSLLERRKMADSFRKVDRVCAHEHSALNNEFMPSIHIVDSYI